MTLKNDRYTYRVTWSDEDKKQVGLCAEFPSLSWFAVTPEAALKGIRKVVAEAVADMKQDGEPVPEPMASRQYTGRFVIRVPLAPTDAWRLRLLKLESASTGS